MLIDRLLSDTLDVYSSDEKFIVIITIIVSFLSILGSCMIIFTYLLVKRIRNYAFKLVVYLSISDVIITLGNILSIETIQDKDEAHAACQTQAIFINYGGLASVLWTSVIAWCIYSATVLSTKNLKDKNWKYLLYGFGVPLIMTLVPFFTNQYGRAGFFCWIKNEETASDTVMRFIQFYIPLWLVLIFNIYSYRKVMKFMKQYVSTHLEVRFIQRLKYYPLVLLLCWSFGTVNRIYNIFGEENKVLSFLHYTMGGLQGFFNALVYGSNDQVKAIWKKVFCSCLCKIEEGKIYKKGEDKSNLKKNEELQSNQREIEMEKSDHGIQLEERKDSEA